MNNMTAVEWLIEKTTESGHLWLTDKPHDMDELYLIVEQAKEMEKEQQIELLKWRETRFTKEAPLEYVLSEFKKL